MPGEVSIEVMDMQGRMVFSERKEYPAGPRRIPIQAKDLMGPGLYFFRLEAGRNVENGKIVLER